MVTFILHYCFASTLISLIFIYHGLYINHYVNRCQKDAKLQAIETFLLVEVDFF